MIAAGFDSESEARRLQKFYMDKLKEQHMDKLKEQLLGGGDFIEIHLLTISSERVERRLAA